MKEANKYERAFSYAAVMYKKVVQYEDLVGASLESDAQIDADLLTDYAKVINGYCDALDLLENYQQEQVQYEKVIQLMAKIGEAHPEYFNVAITTFIKYADVLCKQKKYKKSCESLKTALLFLIDNVDKMQENPLTRKYISNQIHP